MNTEKITNTLTKIGFSPNEIKIYLTLNSNGSTKAGKISKLAKIDRSSCYNSLKTLQEKGLISYVNIGKVKWFQVTGPKRILDYIKEQEEDVQAILPELHSQHKAAKLEGQVRLFKGIKGVKSILFDIIRTGKENLVFGNESQLEERAPEFQKQFVRMLKEKNLLVREIVREDRKTITSNPKKTRYVPKSVESSVVTNIYGDKIALIIWTDEPEGIIIENPAAARAYRTYFEFMWHNAKEK